MAIRVLGAVRLSRLTDESTSPVRQRERIEWWAQGNGATVTYVSEDLDTSGAVSPFKRDSLGPWLTETPPQPWDVLVAWKLDRISRSSMDTEMLLKWCIDHGKRIVCVDDAIDTDTQMGQMWVKLASIFAEVERNAIKERVVQSRKKLRSEARWGGEAVHYGLKPEKLDGGGWTLVHDAEAVQVIRRVLADVYRGDSVQSIADALTSEGVPSSRDRLRQLRGKPMMGSAWSTTTLHRLLESKTLLGYTSHNGEADPSVLKTEPIITATEYRELQTILGERRKPKRVNRTGKASPLLGVAVCYVCDSTLHHRSAEVKGNRYRYYYCPGKDKHAGNMPAGELEALLEEVFLDQLGDIEIHETRVIPASDHTEELENAKLALEDIAQAMGKASSAAVRAALAAQIADLDSLITNLELLPVEPARTEPVPTGVTYGDRWEADTDHRRLLLDSGIRLRAMLEGKGRGKNQGGQFTAELYIPEDIRARMARSTTEGEQLTCPP